MPKLQANGIEIEYDSFGARNGRPLLLIMGFGAQMIFWEEGFCEALAEAGHYVVRYDNRDVGLSSKLDGVRAPGMAEIAEKSNAGESVEVPYTLDDMADDAAGVLDALGLETAHVCGASMGGMVAQTVAIRHHAKLRSFISIMSTTGDPSVPPARPEAMEVLLAPPPDGRDAAIEAEVATQRVIGSPGFPFDEDHIRKRAARVYDRCFYPQGRVRQMAAIMAHGDRTRALGAVSAPALIIHGTDDPLIPVEGGRATAAALQNAELLLIDGMGHDLPPPVWTRVADAIAKHTLAAEA